MRSVKDWFRRKRDLGVFRDPHRGKPRYVAPVTSATLIRIRAADREGRRDSETERMIREQPISGSIGFPWTDHLLRVLMDGLPLAVCLHDGTGAIVDFNTHALKLWGCNPEPGDRGGCYGGFHQLYLPDGAPMPMATSPVVHVIDTGQAMIDVQTVGERADGGLRSLMVSVLPLSQKGAIAGAISCFRDVPERPPNDVGKPREWEALSRMCGALGHDLANLFQAVRLNVNLIERRGAGVPELEKPLRGVCQAADRGLALTRQLLGLAGRQHLDCGPVDVNSLLHGMMPDLAALAGPKGRVTLLPAKQLWLAHADVEQLRQAVINIVANAGEAMPEGGEIVISTADFTLLAEPDVRVAGDYVQIVIADSGPGMEREVLDKVFQPYFTTKRGAAKGLGLSTALGILRQHRGDLRVESHPGKGTRVVLSLPRSTGEAPKAVSQFQSAVPEPPHPGGTVMVVDDDAVVRAAVVDMLESDGYAVLASASGQEALDVLRGGRAVDLLLSDVQMSPMCGTELLRRARQLRPGLKAVMLSGLGDVRSVAEDVVVLRKPLRANEFLSRIHQVL